MSKTKGRDVTKEDILHSLDQYDRKLKSLIETISTEMKKPKKSMDKRKILSELHSINYTTIHESVLKKYPYLVNDILMYNDLIKRITRYSPNCWIHLDTDIDDETKIGFRLTDNELVIVKNKAIKARNKLSDIIIQIENPSPFVTFTESATSNTLKETKKLCEELHKHLNKNFEYGIVKDGKLKTHMSNKDIAKYYRFQSPDEFAQHGGGICFDYVEYEEAWLEEHEISCRKFYLITETPPDYDTHTFVVIETEGKFIWVESSMKNSQGIHVFSKLRDLLKMAAWGCFRGSKNKEHLNGVKYSVFEYTNDHPKYGCEIGEYMDWMIDHGKWVFDDMTKKEQPQIVEEAATLSRRGVSGWKHTDATYEEKKNFERAMSFNSEIVYLRKEMNHMTKREIVQRLASLYNKLAEIYDTLEEDYTEVPMKTSRLGFARKPEKRKMSHRQYIDRLIYEIRDNIVELNRHFNRDGVKTVIQKMMDVWEYEKRELHINDHIGDKLVGNLTEKASHKILDKIMDSYVDKFYRGEIFEEAKLSSDDRNDLDDSQFGIPSLRKYPLTDKKHVLQAVRFFNKAPDEYKEELAKNIVKRAKELGVDWENWESLKPYLDKKVQESTHPIQTTHPDATKNDKIYEVKDLKYDKVYFGTPNEYKDGIDCDRPLFVTPFKSLACIFAVSKNKEELGIPYGRFNYHYDEWAHPKNEYIDEIHMQVEGLNDETEHTKDMSGYVYEVDISDLKDHIGKYDWMSPVREYLIHGIDHIDWSNQKKVNVKVHWTGQHSDNPKYHPYQEAVDINSLRQQCQEVYQQASQIHYGCLDENGERITASPFKDSWKMIATYRSQSLQSMEQTKLGVCFEHSFYVAELLKQRNLPYQTFFLNCNIDHTQQPEEETDDIQQESESISIEQNLTNNMSFWHQFTIVPNDADSVVLIETSLTPEKNGVFLVRNMDDAIQHLIQTFGLNLSSQDFDVMKQDLIDVSSFEPRDGDTYIGYIDQAYLNGKFIKNEIRINHQTKTMKTYWQYLKEHDYLSEDGMKINEQIQQMDDNTAFDIINLLNVQQLFTEEGQKFHQSFFTQDKPQLSVSEMESQLKGFVQESYLPNKTQNTLKEKYHYIPLTKQSVKKYQDQGVFRFGLKKAPIHDNTKGAIYIDENHVVVAYVAIEKKTNGQRWITALEVSEEFQGHHYGIDLLQIAVDDFGAEYLSVNKKNKPAIHMYHKYGWSTYDETDKMFLMKLQEGNDLNG